MKGWVRVMPILASGTVSISISPPSRDLLAKLESQKEMLPRAAAAQLPPVASSRWIFLQPLPPVTFSQWILLQPLLPVAFSQWIFLQPLLPQMTSSQWFLLQPLPAPPGSPRLGEEASRQETAALGKDSSPKKTDTNNKGSKEMCKYVVLQITVCHTLQLGI